MTRRRSNQRNAFGRQSHEARSKPTSRRLEGPRSANEAGPAAADRPKPGKARSADKSDKQRSR
jgi:hypothetical protein